MLRLFTVVLMVAILGGAISEDTEAPQELTEEQAKAVVFAVGKQLVAEVDAAVKTINEVFGNPACNDQHSKRISFLSKRGWGLMRDAENGTPPDVVVNKNNDLHFHWFSKRAVASSSETRTSEDHDEAAQGESPTDGASENGTGERTDASRKALSKRLIGIYPHWHPTRRGVVATSSETRTSQDPSETAQGETPADEAVGSEIAGQSDESKEAVTKKFLDFHGHWHRKRVAATVSSETPTAQDPVEAAQDETPADEVQFEADVAKLKDAVSVLNQVLLVAEASLNS